MSCSDQSVEGLKKLVMIRWVDGLIKYLKVARIISPSSSAYTTARKILAGEARRQHIINKK